jgi:lysophospholipase L1-like esterase
MFGGLPNVANLNKFGYRGPAPSPTKPAGEFRLFALGGSTVFNGDPGIAGLLQQRFHKDGLTGVRAFNYGVVSSVSGMDLARLVYEVADQSPDFVLFYNGGNDVLHPWGSDQRPGYPFNFVVFENNPLLRYDLSDYPTWTLTIFGSNIMRLLRRDYFIERLQERKLTEPNAWPPWSSGWEGAIGRHYADNVVKASRFARAYGAGFAVAIQPLIFTGDAPTAHERRILAAFADADERRARARRLYDRLVAETRKRAESESLTVLELGDIFDRLKQPVFTDEIHITQDAKNIITDAIYREIGPLVGHAIARKNSVSPR